RPPQSTCVPYTTLFRSPWIASLAYARSRRTDRVGARTAAGARANRQRIERDLHAGLHPPPCGVDCAWLRRRCAARLDSLSRHARSVVHTSELQSPDHLV